MSVQAQTFTVLGSYNAVQPTGTVGLKVKIGQRPTTNSQLPTASRENGGGGAAASSHAAISTRWCERLALGVGNWELEIASFRHT
jgi:hypothetical protein